MRKLRRTSIEWDRGPGRNARTPGECHTNDDAPERGHHHDLLLLLVRLSADGLAQAAARWGISFCAFVSVQLFCCPVVVSFPFYTGHSLRAPSYMNKK